MVSMTDDSLPDYKALWKQETELRRQAEEARRQARHTTFEEFIRACHNLLSLQLEVGDKSLSTKGSLTKPHWETLSSAASKLGRLLDSQQQLYTPVRKFLLASEEDAPRLFSSVHSLEDLRRIHCSQPLRIEKDLEYYERLAVEDNVRYVIAELCKIPDAREEFKLEDGVQFDDHANALTDVESGRPDEKVVQVVTIPTNRDAKLRYNAEQLTGSALVQQYNVMIRKGLEYSYITNGLALVLLRVCSDGPSALYYCLCEPNREVGLADDQSLKQLRTAVSRVLCLCLMSLRSRTRKQRWRNRAIRQLHTWNTDFDYAWAQIPEEERHQTPPSSESQTGCRPQQAMHRSESMDSSDSDPNQASVWTEAASQSDQSLPPPPSQRHSRQIGSQSDRRCLLSLQQGGMLDSRCPNVELHRQGRDSDRHLISSERLVQLLKQQLDENLDHDCTPFCACSAYGAPFKVTCVPYGYTVVGKGTTFGLWNEVAQGYAVPVFLVAIDLKQIYFHDEGDIRDMLLMAFGEGGGGGEGFGPSKVQ
ncbi:hypothetical protein V1506DRAFT_526681 [Lipomyces tetrasporus]